MSEPTLALKIADIQAKLGTFAGWGRGSLFGDPAWSSFQQATIDDATQSGLRRFYYCGYDWSFLRPNATLTLKQGHSTIALPDDFQASEGTLTIVPTGSQSQPWEIRWNNAAFIRGLYAVNPQQTAPPMWVAEEPLKGTSNTAGQRKQLLFFPLADQTYTVNLCYYINPDYLTTAFPYAYGGPQHTETILESCLACMEQKLDDTMSTHSQAFERLLEQSQMVDRRSKPQTLGRNRDMSDWEGGYDRYEQHYWEPQSTYNGTTFG